MKGDERLSPESVQPAAPSFRNFRRQKVSKRACSPDKKGLASLMPFAQGPCSLKEGELIERLTARVAIVLAVMKTHPFYPAIHDDAFTNNRERRSRMPACLQERFNLAQYT
jgi:hypothetical protein